MTNTNKSNPERPIRWLVTLGPTHEPIDQVRFIGNRSSGRMGFEIAKAAKESGAQVRILAGPCSLPKIDSWTDVARFQTAADLRKLLTTDWPNFDVLVMAAAVADWRVVGAPLVGKIRRDATPPVLQLEPVAEIVGNLQTRHNQFVVGFALEPKDEVIANARQKLLVKKVDCIVANSLETLEGAQSDARIVWGDGRILTHGESSEFAAKSKVARWIVKAVSPSITQKCRDR
ncbi:MAG: phosphopantothenoylcysteine decarboxylase [Phycisphaerales bacterium]|nr:phosphopantothenoylcysteine decarboxylase [Phycisphaerales bacterium]